MKTILLITIFSLNMFLNHFINARAEVPTEARLVAEKELKSLIAKASLVFSDSSRPISSFGVTYDELRNATIADPFLVRWGVDAEQVLKSDASTLLDQASYSDFCFPVVVGETTICTINVREDANAEGGYIESSQFEWSEEFQHLIDLRKDYPSDQGYEVSRLHIGYAGTFIVIEQNKKPVYITPLTRMAARTLSMDIRQDLKYPIMPIADAVPGIKAAATRYLQYQRQSSETRDNNSGE